MSSDDSVAETKRLARLAVLRAALMLVSTDQLGVAVRRLTEQTDGQGDELAVIQEHLAVRESAEHYLAASPPSMPHASDAQC